jgi:hypothetical protein
MLHAVATSAATFTAVNVQHVELADQISEKMIAPSRGITHRHKKRSRRPLGSSSGFRIASLIDALSFIFFVPTLAFKFLVFPECWIVGRPLTKWRRY